MATLALRVMCAVRLLPSRRFFLSSLSCSSFLGLLSLTLFPFAAVVGELRVLSCLGSSHVRWLFPEIVELALRGGCSG